jgi:hypothetical protein
MSGCIRQLNFHLDLKELQTVTLTLTQTLTQTLTLILTLTSYEVAAVQMGGRISRLNFHVDLKEPGSNCSVNGVTLG